MITDLKEKVRACAAVLADSRAINTTIIDLTAMGSWTDYFIVASATSSTHMRGLWRNLEEYTDQQDLAPLRKPSLVEDDDWCLIDFGDFLVHIMSDAAREFYDLESLWHEGVIERVEAKNPAEQA
ncbi:MAG: ribosome silencing factor [Spirochaetes bacterium]|nr:ribosome silencing factor [Spirochaetota bacterium]MBU0955122.1 ribosome silencing factor [Spirochaetota bacterium]